MRAIAAVARSTFRETIREKLLFLVAAYGLVLMVSTWILSPLSVGAARDKIVVDVGLAGISLFGVLTAIMIGGALVHKEIDKKAVYLVLTRPVSRGEYLVGKFAGIMGAIGSLVGLMAVLLVLIMLAGRVEITRVLFAAVALSLVEIAVIAAVVVFFSTFTTPILTSFFTIGVFIAGSLGSDLRAFAQKFGGAAMQRTMDAMYFALPNLTVFNLRSEAVHGLRLTAFEFFAAVLYGTVYAGAMLYFAWLVLRRREFA
ncbi:MAG: ABC transporter permease subunit [Candidatus Krumholzibacteria bacterium]|nr:ABC transporter permease subunit [Candidatus Krumholzibacteria bacterium]